MHTAACSPPHFPLSAAGFLGPGLLSPLLDGSLTLSTLRPPLEQGKGLP